MAGEETNTAADGIRELIKKILEQETALEIVRNGVRVGMSSSATAFTAGSGADTIVDMLFAVQGSACMVNDLHNLLDALSGGDTDSLPEKISSLIEKNSPVPEICRDIFGIEVLEGAFHPPPAGTATYGQEGAAEGSAEGEVSSAHHVSLRAAATAIHGILSLGKETAKHLAAGTGARESGPSQDQENTDVPPQEIPKSLPFRTSLTLASGVEALQGETQRRFQRMIVKQRQLMGKGDLGAGELKLRKAVTAINAVADRLIQKALSVVGDWMSVLLPNDGGLAAAALAALGRLPASQAMGTVVRCADKIPNSYRGFLFETENLTKMVEALITTVAEILRGIPEYESTSEKVRRRGGKAAKTGACAVGAVLIPGGILVAPALYGKAGLDLIGAGERVDVLAADFAQNKVKPYAGLSVEMFHFCLPILISSITLKQCAEEYLKTDVKRPLLVTAGN